MAKRTTKVPDAWDDDWEAQADKAAAAETQEDSEPQPQASMSRAERLAQHAESNRKLWESAEAPPETFHYLAARSDPPLAMGFKPAMKVLSRKPVAAGGVRDDDEDEDAQKTPQLTPEERLAKQQREREEKQRRYDEARAKIFGTSAGGPGVVSSNPSSGASTPGAVTPPRSAEGRGPRGRGRGGRGGGGHRRNESRGERDRDRDSNQRPGSQSGAGRELYDPNYAPKPGFQLERRGNSNSNNSDGGAPLPRRSTPREEDQVIRAPRGPDGSGRGGFGFARRGAKDS
ncbi:hypothetical protein GGS26DRAFT_593874 [Hypomontagnella submonticulosa]|nr:hypothetical protein GGS26DRAFT_593874 [Hypomontagnella submonticulosa]